MEVAPIFGIDATAREIPLHSSHIPNMQNAIATAPPSCGDSVVRSHERLLRHLATRFLSTGVALDDLMQEGRIALWLATEKWRADGGANLWTYARRSVFASMLRCASSHLDEAHSPLDEETTEANGAASAEVALLVHECLASLSEEQRDVVKRTMEGETFKAIGVSLGRSESWAHRVFHKAAALLQERVNAS